MRIVKIACPECKLRLELRERPGGGFEQGPAETAQPKCVHERDDVLRCPSLKKALVMAAERLRP
jgi:hypothetical protein